MLMGLDLLVFVYDYVGYGQSEGERMVVFDFYVFIRDVLQYVDFMQKDYFGFFVFFLGYFMGGVIVIFMVVERLGYFVGMVFILFLVFVNFEFVIIFKVFVVKVFNFVLLNLFFGFIDFSVFFWNKIEVDIYNLDFLICWVGLKVCFGIQLLNVVLWVECVFFKLMVFFLLFQGFVDCLCDSKGVYLFMELVKSQDKIFKIYEGVYYVFYKEFFEVINFVFYEINMWVF